MIIFPLKLAKRERIESGLSGAADPGNLGRNVMFHLNEQVVQAQPFQLTSNKLALILIEGRLMLFLSTANVMSLNFTEWAVLKRGSSTTKIPKTITFEEAF